MKPHIDMHASIGTRLAIGFGLFIAVTTLIVSAIFYFGTIGVLERKTDAKISAISNRLVESYGGSTRESLASEIRRLLSDGIDTDTEIFLLLSAPGQFVAGNLPNWSTLNVPTGKLFDHRVTRDGNDVLARLIVRSMPNGDRLIVGRDLRELDAIRVLVGQAIAGGLGIAILFTIGGAYFLRHQVESRIGEIRRAALEIEAGNLKRRIPISGNDEFNLLNRDINRMLDRIEHLMEGVRHVSNAIAHDLRTPLNRIRNHLDEALRHHEDHSRLAEAAQAAMSDIDNLIQVFEKLLQIAEAESGVRPQTFERVDLSGVVTDIVELYDAAAEERGVKLENAAFAPIYVTGDRNLLGSALACLIDNAIKYAGAHATVRVRTKTQQDAACLVVQDDGPGIPAAELEHVTKRFYRVDQSRHLPGNGLGLSIVAAVALLHQGALRLEDAKPGLIASLVLPVAGNDTSRGSDA